MVGSTPGLSQVVALFQLQTIQLIPQDANRLVPVATLDVAEVAALAITLRMSAALSDLQADGAAGNKPNLVIVSQEDWYDPTL